MSSEAVFARVARTTLLMMYIIGIGCSSTSGKDCVVVSIRSDKPVYLSYEPVSVFYTVHNARDTVTAMTYLSFGEHFFITNQDGRQYRNTQFIDFARFLDTLDPGASYTGREKIDLRYYVQLPGRYTCVLRINAENMVYPRCAGEIVSNTITFAIVEPTGFEREALRLYLQADSLNLTKDRNNWKKALATFIEMARKYPESVYAASALYSAAQLGEIAEDRRVIIDACHTLIEKHPESPFFAWTFSHMFNNYAAIKDKSGAVAYSKSLIQKYPGTAISATAQSWLPRVEAWPE
jgi:hypothetical protein